MLKEAFLHKIPGADMKQLYTELPNPTTRDVWDEEGIFLHINDSSE